MKHTTKLAASALILAMTLAACGGGGGNDDAPAPTAPGSSSSTPSSSSSSSSSAATSTSSSSSSETTSSSSSTSNSSSSSAPATGIVFQAKFNSVPAGMSDNAEITLTDPVALPAEVNTDGYSAKLVGKLKVNTQQAIPADMDAATWSTGVVQFSNNTTSIGKVAVSGVTCPFKLTIHHAPGNTTDPARKLKITVGSNEVYYAGGGVAGATVTPGYTAVVESGSNCTNGKADIEAFGFNDTNGSGVRLYDFIIER